MTHLAFLLHMHQPLYVDPASGVALLPWVRLHAARAYLDVARLLDEYPEVRLTVNFVPSLLEQLEAVVAGARDAWLEIAEKPAHAWTRDDRAFLVERFFSVAWSPNVECRPRYRELLDLRGREVPAGAMAERAERFSNQDLRDLTVLFHLAWLGFAARESDPHKASLLALEQKGRGYDEADLRVVIDAGRAACARVLPLYRKLSERGQVELSSSPFYHPIVPLVCDTEAARRASPRMHLPDRFSFPTDGRRQIALGKAAHARIFGAAPRGMWPPEGSISPEALSAYRDEGIGWVASDEGNLFRSIDPPGQDGASDRGLLYRPWRFSGVDVVFRDRDISDRIGFRYAHGDARAAVDDLIGRVRHAGELGRAASVPAPLVSVILDGENPWENYPGSGEPFLRALFEEIGRRQQAGDLRSTTIGAFLAAHADRGTLARLHSGSWIDSDFHIWIGDPVKNRAWNLLGRARRRLQRAEASPGSLEKLDEARRHLDAAEGSDWFWWFGEPFHSAEDALFDRLFRAHLAAAWRALGEPPPDELDEPVSRAASPPAMKRPRARITPSIDGRVGSYFEWVGAGTYEVPRGAAMAELPPVAQLYFGFDDEAIYLRLDPSEGGAPRLATATVEISARTIDAERHFIASPGAAAFSEIPLAPADLSANAAGASPREAPSPVGPVGKIACADVVEIALPFAAVGAAPGDRIELAVRLHEGPVLLCRLPRDGAVELRAPDAHFDADHWLL